MLVGEPLGGDPAVFARDRPKQRPVADATEPHPGLEQRDGAGVGARAAADLDLAPAGLAKNLQQGAAVHEFDPAGPVLGLIGTAIEADDFGAAQRPGEAERQNGAVAQAAQVHVERGKHGQQLVGEDRRLLDRRTCVLAADAGEHGGDVAVAGVERLPKLAVAPTDPGKPPLERRDADAGLGLRGEMEPDGLRLWRQLIKTVAAEPGGELPPVGVIGARRVFAAGGARVGFGGFGEPGEVRIGRRKGRGGRGVLFRKSIVGRVEVRRCFVFVRTFPTPRGGLEGVAFAEFFRAFGDFRIASDKPTLSDMFFSRQARRISAESR